MIYNVRMPDDQEAVRLAAFAELAAALEAVRCAAALIELDGDTRVRRLVSVLGLAAARGEQALRRLVQG